MTDVFITGLGIYLPNSPINNQEIESYLGKVNGEESKVKSRILKQNGIKTRYFAMDKNQQTTHSNAQLASNAIEQALERTIISKNEVQHLATGTTQGDLPVPGFASMVHGESGIAECEIASFQSVCASGVMALKNGFSLIKSGQKENALAVGSELASRLLRHPDSRHKG